MPQEPQGRRHALQHLPRRAENLYHHQLHHAALRRAGRAEAVGRGHPAADGRPVPADQAALLRDHACRARANHGPGRALFGPLPRDAPRRIQRARHRSGLRQALFDEGLHLQGRARHAHDPARFDSSPQAYHARRVPRARPAHGLRQGLCRRPQLPLFPSTTWPSRASGR